MNAKNSILLWNPGTNQVAIHLKPLNGAGNGFERSSLGCYALVQKMSFEERKTLVFMEAMHLIIRDGCDPLAVHAALLQLDEYQAGLACDMPGAKP